MKQHFVVMNFVMTRFLWCKINCLSEKKIPSVIEDEGVKTWSSDTAVGGLKGTRLLAFLFFLPTDFLWFDSQVGHEVTNNKVIVEGAEEQESLFKVLQLYDLFSFVSFLFPVKSLHLAVLCKKILRFFFLFHTRTISIYFLCLN